ncbi:hypothetical protein J3R83DRAFT_12329 [Lanmaoa asiatica]|nr:hypothetical protein J3R83DRAFT_12329 [Lanmaoa asiatica]
MYSFPGVTPPSTSQAVQPGSSPLVDQYTLLSFSTGSILEDEFSLSWYSLRPYELLEMHPLGVVAPLQRDVLAEYIQPYFQAKVRVLRAVWDHRSGRFEAPGIDIQREHSGYKPKDKLAHRLDSFSPKSSSLQSEKRRKTKVDWKTRWVVINQGVLSLCKGHVTTPLHQFALSTMRALRGADALERAFSIVTQPRVVCIMFRPRTSSQTGVASPPPSSPSSPISDILKTNRLPHEQTTEQEHPRERSDEYAYDTNDPCKGEGEWIVLDMLDDHGKFSQSRRRTHNEALSAFSSILRILHRHACQPMSSSFVPSPSLISVSHHSIASPAATSFASYDTIPYPEWRINTVENARKAGMGDVGKPMAWVLWTEKGIGETLLGNIRHHREAFSREMQYKTTTVLPDIYCGSDDDSDDDSEMEWEGWMRDLERQSRAKERSEMPISSTVSRPLPSPPLSEASPSASPRVRSPSLSVSHLATGSYPHTQYPNIGNVIQVSGARDYRPTEFLRSSERIKNTTISTVSVGAVPLSRRRSETLSTDLVTTAKRDHDNGRAPIPSIPMGGARPSAGVQRSPRILVRHAHSSSNLRISSSPPYGSDVAEYPGPSSPSKRQSAFMRGVSSRAGKIVRGLESAIDFVDEKTV